MAASLLRHGVGSRKSLTTAFSKGFSNTQSALLKPDALCSNILRVATRNMGGARVIPQTPSRFGWTLFKDHVHFYVMLAGIPLGALVVYTKLFVGDAELAEIPEGYEPRCHEYHKNPIERWFIKHVYETEQKVHEANLGYRKEEKEKQLLRLWKKEVKTVMTHQQNYHSWLFIPVSTTDVQQGLQYMEKWGGQEGSNIEYKKV